MYKIDGLSFKDFIFDRTQLFFKPLMLFFPNRKIKEDHKKLKFYNSTNNKVINSYEQDLTQLVTKNSNYQKILKMETKQSTFHTKTRVKPIQNYKSSNSSLYKIAA